MSIGKVPKKMHYKSVRRTFVETARGFKLHIPSLGVHRPSVFEQSSEVLRPLLFESGLLFKLGSVRGSWTRTSGSWHEAVRDVCQADEVRTLLRPTTRANAALSHAPLCVLMAARPPSSAGQKKWPARAHAGSLECCAPWRRLRWQDASSSGRRRIQTESGGTRVPRHAPMVIWSVWPCEREVRDCARPVQRSIVYV